MQSFQREKERELRKEGGKSLLAYVKDFPGDLSDEELVEVP